jgi:6-pyruvoyl-tetrahydropterin synthase
VTDLTLTARFSFDAAFRPPGAGADDPPMGYSFEASVVAQAGLADVGAEGRLTELVRTLHDALDHTYLNAVIGDDVTLPRLAAWLLDAARAREPAVTCVEVGAPQVATTSVARIRPDRPPE